MKSTSLRILALRASEAEMLVLDAEDDVGPVTVRVPYVLWEDLQAEAPVLSDAEDRRDYALGMIEHRAQEVGVGEDRTITLG